MKKLSFLFAVLVCTWGMLQATNVKVRTLIPTDSEFTTTGTIVFTWNSKGGGATTSIVLNREGATSRWWGATVIIPDETEFEYSLYTETSATTKDVAQVGGWSPSSYVAKDKPELNIEIAALVDDTSDPNQRVFLVEEVSATAPDHDYRITDLQVQDIGNGITITWTANNLAPNYYINIMDDTRAWEHEEFVTVTEGKFTYYYDGTNDIHIGTLLLFPCYYDGVSDYHPYVKMYQEDLNIDFQTPEKVINQSLKAEQKDKTIEISWEHYPAVDMYIFAVVYDSWYDEQVIMPKFIPAKDGKYTQTIDELPGNGDYEFYFTAYNADGDVIADITSSVTVTGFPSLDEVDLRVLIPSDNDMDISYGVWFQWWDMETQTKSFIKADQDAAGVWFSKKITTDKSAIQFCVCNRPDASGDNSESSPIISTKQACFEMQYQEYGAWELKEAECDAPDHDYRMTNVQVEAVSNPVDLLTITITAVDYASAYRVEARESGVGYYLTLEILPYEGSNIFSFPLPFTQAGNYDYRITPINKDNEKQVAEEKTGTVTITSANTNIPTNLNAAVGTDHQTVTFSWMQPSPTTVDHYTLEIPDYGYKAEYIYDLNHAIKFYITRTHLVTWHLYAYNADDVLVAQASHGDGVAIVSYDYSPKDLKVAVEGNKATFTWATQENVQACRFYLYDQITGDDIVNETISGTDGQFSTTYTLKEDKTLFLGWMAQAITQGSFPMSNSVDGENFMLVGKARVPQTKEMTPTFGHLSWDEINNAWGATVYEYNAAQEPLFVFTLSMSGQETTIPITPTITLTNNTDDRNMFAEASSGGEEPEFGDMIKNANLTISYNGGLRTKDDGSGGTQIYVLVKISGEMSTGFGDRLIINQPADFIELYVSGIDTSTALDQITNDKVQCTKILRDGQLLILRDGKLYNAQGAEVK